MNQALTLRLVLVSGILWSPAVSSAQQDPTHLESVLLQTDAVIFADVVGLKPIPEGGLVQVELASVNVVQNRWPDPPTSFRVVGELADDEVEFGHHRRLTQGRRYLLFLRGGRWFSAPLIDFAVAIYPVAADGTVLCAGGSVYGLGRTNLECSTPERQAGTPLVEQRLATLLQSARRRAVRHRPAEAAGEDASARVLRPGPVFR